MRLPQRRPALNASDTGSFGSLQALPSFKNHFGQVIKGAKGFTAQRRATMNSVVWAGKLTGTILFEPIVSRFGYKWTVYGVCLLQIVAVIVEGEA